MYKVWSIVEAHEQDIGYKPAFDTLLARFAQPWSRPSESCLHDVWTMLFP